MDVLLINAIAYSCVFLYSIFKYRRINIYNSTLLAFTVVAILGYITTKMGIQLVDSVNFGEHTSVVPYICLFISVLFIISPLKKLNNLNMSFDEIDCKPFHKFIYFSMVVYVLVTIVMIYKIYLVMQQGFAEAYLSRRLDGEELVQFDNFFLNFAVTKGITYVNATFAISTIYLFNNLLKKKNILWSVIGLLLCFLPNILSSLSAGSKGMLFFNAFDIIFFYLLFESYLPRVIKKTFVLGGFGIAFLLITYAVNIQNDRNEAANSEKMASEVMMRYLGESMPNLGDLYVDVKQHPYGKRFFPLFTGGYLADTAEEYSDYWAKYTHARIDNFKTIWGDAFVEFGFIGSFVFLFIIVYLYRKYVFSHCNNIYIYPLIYYYYNKVCIYGIFNVCFVDMRSLQVTLYAILLSIFLYKITKNKAIGQYKLQ